MNSPIIVFNPSGLTDEQVKQIKDALDAAYRAGYDTAKEFYQLKMTVPTNQNNGQTLTVPPQQWVVNDCTQQGTYASSYQPNCNHMYVNDKNKALGICGLCGISFDEWYR